MDLRSKLGLYKEGMEKTSSAALKCDTGSDVNVLVPGSVHTNGDGCCYVIENSYPLSHRHGGCNLGDARKVGSDIIALMGGRTVQGCRQTAYCIWIPRPQDCPEAQVRWPFWWV